ncbi:MAG: hypothetical protein ACE5F1_16740 [Planctomycetota bacterium]
MRSTSAIACLAFLLAPLSAQDAPTAAEIIEPGRSLTRPLDSTLHDGSNRPQEGIRWLVLLVDLKPSLAGAGFTSELERALSRNAEHLPGTRIGVARVGREWWEELRPERR